MKHIMDLGSQAVKNAFSEVLGCNIIQKTFKTECGKRVKSSSIVLDGKFDCPNCRKAIEQRIYDLEQFSTTVNGQLFVKIQTAIIGYKKLLV